MGIEISDIGLATAQGGTVDILNRSPISAPGRLFWRPRPWTTCQVCYPAKGVDPMLQGIERWQALAKIALDDCIGTKTLEPDTSLIIASCNGSANNFDIENWQNAFDSERLLNGTLFRGQRLPVVSGACVSGLQALYLATKLLMAGIKQVIILAVDILSPASHDNYEALRILAGHPAPPWQINSSGFIPGEAAVALCLRHTTPQSRNPQLKGPMLSQDLNNIEGLNNVLAGLAPPKPDLVFGQGTGPYEIDEVELKMLRSHINMKVPLTSALVNFGHTNGASGLLSVALAALAWRSSTSLPVLNMPAKFATDGRPLGNGVVVKNDVVIICRALGGACAAVSLTRENQHDLARNDVWGQPADIGPLMHPLLRKIAAEAIKMRPERPPDMLIVRLATPLTPPLGSRIGERLLPSTILEITPGFLARLIARCWGFVGAAICLVGDNKTNSTIRKFIHTFQDSGQIIYFIDVQGKGEERYVKWAA